MSHRTRFNAAIAFAALSTMAGLAAAVPSGAYTMAPIWIGKVEARTREALLENAAYIEAAPQDGVVRVRLERFDPAVREVEVEGLGRPVTVTDSAVLVIPSAEGKAPVRRTLNYTVRYSDMVIPGFRPAPLRISVLP
jgi:hypothetical protein